MQKSINIAKFRNALDVALASRQPITQDQLDLLQTFIFLNITEPTLADYRQSCQDRLNQLACRYRRQAIA